ncbi:hypothetical protein C7Y72_19815 [Paraconexibacter algicola]|uniref:Uncharacterized protein n=1 Tax=Paraconexibacter algicola TaxID=2133960 RepID=A0A2T4UC75_9ACTN|nr:hypothetical protein C7Y72_19815 [Paraconexibacter algicola]
MAAVVAGLCFGGVAYGQGAGGDQYTPGNGVNTTPVGGQGTTPTATPTPAPTTEDPGTPAEEQPTDSGGTENENQAGENAAEDDGASEGDTASGGDAATTTGSGDTSAAPTGFPTNRVTVLTWGLASDDLLEDIRQALEGAGLQVLFEGDASSKTLKEFLESDEAKALSSEGPRAIGRAFGAQLVNPTPALTDALPVIFKNDPLFAPVIRAVLTRRAGISKDAAELLEGVAEGLRSTGIPVAYVEISDTKPSFVEDYEDLKIPVVDNVDTTEGKQKLGAIMLGEGSTTESVTPDSASALGAAPQTDDGAPTGSIALVLALLGCVALFFMNQARRARR